MTNEVEWSREQWLARSDAHRDRARMALASVVERRSRGEKHPVWDFLFDYYRLRPSELVAWSPGAGVRLLSAPEFAGRRFFTTDEAGAARVDVAAFLGVRRGTLDFTRRLLTAVDSRPAHFGCFGLHEWAMVHRLPAEAVRHAAVPLRHSPEETAAIVEAHDLRCSHFDAFRFFTPTAAPLNQRPLTRDDQLATDQGGCLHVNMDLYKWAGKLHPLTSSELLFDCYELACDIRALDMRASAYDLAEWGFEAVPVETPEGKAEYVRQQRLFAERAEGLRARLLAEIETMLACAPSVVTGGS
ncbi:3-methyladenine DNA glycosylase [Aestuariimicrobium soli]|uniref:3-methyladenine DNA glycosylase n=1 Tax=Aestuariimicrobium soli TaxID=2035834 RepID=UPI003EBC28E6